MSYVLNGGETEQVISGALSLDGFKFPVQDGLRALYMMNRGVETLGVNYGSARDAEIIGEPVPGIGFSEISRDGYLDTKLAETADLTVVLAVGDMSINVGYFGNYHSNDNRGVSIYTISNGSKIVFSADRADGAGSLMFDKTDNIALYSLRADTSGNFVEDHTNNIKKQITTLGARNISGVGDFRVGKLGQVTLGNPTKMALLAIFDRSINDDELDAVVLWGRASLGKYGISV